MAQARDSSPVYYREIQKTAYLKRVPEEQNSSKLLPLGLKKQPLKALFTQLCIHNGRSPFLEQYKDPVSARAHRPIWRRCLGTARHVSASVTSTENEWDFMIDTEDGGVRMMAPDWESMQDWVSSLRCVLAELRVVSACENVYVSPPAPAPAPAPRAPARDPTSPLPAPPAPPHRVPGIDLPMHHQSEPPTEPQAEPNQTQEPVPETDIDISNWDAPSTSLPPTQLPTKLTKICGQNICLDDSIFKRGEDSDGGVDNDSSDEYRQTVVVSDGKNGDSASDRPSNVTVIQVSNSNKEPPHTAIPIMQQEVFNFNIQPPSFVNIVNTENIQNSNEYGTVFENSDYGHLSLTTTVNLTGEKVTADVNLTDDVKSNDVSQVTGVNEDLYERLCLASTDVSSPLSIRKIRHQDKVRKSSLPNLDITSGNSTYEYLFLAQNNNVASAAGSNSTNFVPVSTNSMNCTSVSTNLTQISTSFSTVSTNISTSTVNSGNYSSSTNLNGATNIKSNNVVNTTVTTINSTNSSCHPNHSSMTPNHSSMTPNHSSMTPNHSSMTPNHSSTNPNQASTSSRTQINTPLPNTSCNNVLNSLSGHASHSVSHTNTSKNNLISSINHVSNPNSSMNPSPANHSSSNQNYSSMTPNNSSSNQNYSSMTPNHSSMTPNNSSSHPNEVTNGNARLHINNVPVNNMSSNARAIRPNIERSMSHNSNEMPQRREKKENGPIKNIKTDKEQTKPIWKRGLTELSLLTRLKGIGQGKRSDSPSRNTPNDRNGVASPVKLVHRSRPEARSDHRRRSSSLSNGERAGGLVSLRCRQALSLREEQRRGAALVASVLAAEPPVLFDYNHMVWLARRAGGGAGDRLAAVGGAVPASASRAARALASNHRTEILYHRVPLGKIFVVNKKDKELLGIKLDSECNISSVEADSPAARAGIPPVGKWAVTEVNNRPINLLKGGDEEMNRISYRGTETSILIQPAAFVKALRSALKANKSLLGLR